MNTSILLQIQTQAEEVITDGVVDKPLWDIVKESSQGFGLIINVLLALMLGYAIFVFVERYLALRKATKEEAGLLSKIKDYIMDGKIDSAKDFCSRSNSPSARMIEKGLSRLGRPIETISASIENTGKLEIFCRVNFPIHNVIFDLG